MDLVGNDVDILYEEIKYLVDHLVGNDVDTLHEERIHLVEFSFIRVIDYSRGQPLLILKNLAHVREPIWLTRVSKGFLAMAGELAWQLPNSCPYSLRQNSKTTSPLSCSCIYPERALDIPANSEVRSCDIFSF